MESLNYPTLNYFPAKKHTNVPQGCTCTVMPSAVRLKSWWIVRSKTKERLILRLGPTADMLIFYKCFKISYVQTRKTNIKQHSEETESISRNTAAPNSPIPLLMIETPNLDDSTFRSCLTGFFFLFCYTHLVNFPCFSCVRWWNWIEIAQILVSFLREYNFSRSVFISIWLHIYSFNPLLTLYVHTAGFKFCYDSPNLLNGEIFSNISLINTGFLGIFSFPILRS